MCNLLLVVNSNFGRISNHFRDIDAQSYKIPYFPRHPCLNLVQLEIPPFDPPILKTLRYVRTWSESDASFASYLPLNYTLTLKLELKITQGHRQRHYSIEHIWLYIHLVAYSKYVYLLPFPTYWSRIASLFLFGASVRSETLMPNTHRRRRRTKLQRNSAGADANWTSDPPV